MSKTLRNALVLLGLIALEAILCSYVDMPRLFGLLAFITLVGWMFWPDVDEPK